MCVLLSFACPTLRSRGGEAVPWLRLFCHFLSGFLPAPIPTGTPGGHAHFSPRGAHIPFALGLSLCRAAFISSFSLQNVARHFRAIARKMHALVGSLFSMETSSPTRTTGT
jgi:hypothetical protein